MAGGAAEVPQTQTHGYLNYLWICSINSHSLFNSGIFDCFELCFRYKKILLLDDKQVEEQTPKQWDTKPTLKITEEEIKCYKCLRNRKRGYIKEKSLKSENVPLKINSRLDCVRQGEFSAVILVLPGLESSRLEFLLSLWHPWDE